MKPKGATSAAGFLGLIFFAILTLLSSQATAQTIDHFKCYEANGDPVNVNVNLEDQFGVEPGVPVEEPKLFCNPVDKNGEGIGDPTAHLTGYEIGDDHAERIVIVSNQFGAGQILQIEDPEILFVPSKKNAVPSDLNLDYFKCYKAQGVPVNVNVNLTDQFGVELDVLVGIPALFCNPVDKNGEGMMNPDADLTCYEIDADQGAEQVVVIDNQFGQQNRFLTQMYAWSRAMAGPPCSDRGYGYSSSLS